MSLRSLPELNRPAARDVTFVLNERAQASWAPGLAPKAVASDDTSISILEPIGLDWWTGEGVTAKRIAAALRGIGDRPVTVLINSPGGDFFEGVTIYNLLRQHPAEVTVKILGIAASAASVIAMAGDRIEIAKAGFLMIHNTQWCACGDRHVMRETADIMDVFDAAMNGLFADRTGQAVETIAAWSDAEHWVAGTTAVEEGFADALLEDDEVARGAPPQNGSSALYRVERALARQGVPRAERRRLMKEITQGTPGAALDDAMPRAGDPDGADGAAHLKLALAHLKLTGV